MLMALSAVYSLDVMAWLAMIFLAIAAIAIAGSLIVTVSAIGHRLEPTPEPDEMDRRPDLALASRASSLLHDDESRRLCSLKTASKKCISLSEHCEPVGVYSARTNSGCNDYRPPDAASSSFIIFSRSATRCFSASFSDFSSLTA